MDVGGLGQRGRRDRLQPAPGLGRGARGSRSRRTGPRPPAAAGRRSAATGARRRPGPRPGVRRPHRAGATRSPRPSRSAGRARRPSSSGVPADAPRAVDAQGARSQTSSGVTTQKPSLAVVLLVGDQRRSRPVSHSPAAVTGRPTPSRSGRRRRHRARRSSGTGASSAISAARSSRCICHAPTCQRPSRTAATIAGDRGTWSSSIPGRVRTWSAPGVRAGMLRAYGPPRAERPGVPRCTGADPRPPPELWLDVPLASAAPAWCPR